MDINLEGDGQFKEVLKQALVEIIAEQPELFAEVLAEALESFILAHGIGAVEAAQDLAQPEVLKTMARGA